MVAVNAMESDDDDGTSRDVEASLVRAGTGVLHHRSQATAILANREMLISHPSF